LLIPQQGTKQPPRPEEREERAITKTVGDKDGETTTLIICKDIYTVGTDAYGSKWVIHVSVGLDSYLIISNDPHTLNYEGVLVDLS
jgi:hypothetical protein